MQIKSIIPETAALLESEEIRKCRRIGLDAETVGLPCARRHPGNGYVEAVQIVSRADLCGGHFLHLDIIAGRHIYVHLRREFDIAVETHCLRDAVLGFQHLGGVVHNPRPVAAEGIAEVRGPGNVGVGVVEPAARNIFARVRVRVNPLIQTESKLLKEVTLFDVYEGKNLPAGKKSYAVSFLLQDESQTLNDVQIDKVMNKLIQAVQTKLDAQLR